MQPFNLETAFASKNDLNPRFGTPLSQTINNFNIVNSIVLESTKAVSPQIKDDENLQKMFGEESNFLGIQSGVDLKEILGGRDHDN